MSIKLSELFGSMDEAFNNQKLEEMFNKTKDVAENMSKKSAERLEISRKRLSFLMLKQSFQSFMKNSVNFNIQNISVKKSVMKK